VEYRPSLPVFAFTIFTLLMPHWLAPNSAWAEPQYKVLHNFTAGSDGGELYGSLVFDKEGNLYGTTSYGGRYEGGTAFEMGPQASGEWDLTVLYSFCKVPPHCEDGGLPDAGMIFDTAGNLYGAATDGGRGKPAATGTAFELTPSGDKWKAKTIYNFSMPQGEAAPQGGFVMDDDGNLYGASSAGFKLWHGPNGWKTTVLHRFGKGSDGYEIDAPPIIDPSGNLYGTTMYGGDWKDCPGTGCGTVWELSPQPGGKWKEYILHRFTGGDGAWPGRGALYRDSSGNLYGTTGGYNSGTVYELSRDGEERWHHRILHTFTAGSGGNSPGGGVVMDKAGNLYGTTALGGDPGCSCGVVYEMSPGKDGKWSYTVLHTFIGADGVNPVANMIFDDQGNLYGTTLMGGSSTFGVAFELTP
jgi:uncharacterized repeat protein (TIGR03803 family)